MPHFVAARQLVSHIDNTRPPSPRSVRDADVLATVKRIAEPFQPRRGRWVACGQRRVDIIARRESNRTKHCEVSVVEAHKYGIVSTERRGCRR